MKITYTQNGDYLIPNIKIRKAKKSIGHYGRLRKAYLQQFRPILYNELILTEKLYEHCAEIEETARHRIWRYRKAESRKPDGMGAADERLQGSGRGNREARANLYPLMKQNILTQRLELICTKRCAVL